MELIRAAAEFIRVIVRTAPANAGRTYAWAQTGLATAGIDFARAWSLPA